MGSKTGSRGRDENPAWLGINLPVSDVPVLSQRQPKRQQVSSCTVQLRTADQCGVEGGRKDSFLVGFDICNLPVYLKFLTRTAVKKQGCTYTLVMWTILIRTICLLPGILNIPRMTYSPVASIPFYLEAWVAVHWFLNQKKSVPAFRRWTCFKRKTNLLCPARSLPCL